MSARSTFLHENLCIEAHIVILIIEESSDLRPFYRRPLPLSSQLKADTYSSMTQIIHLSTLD